MNSWFIFDFILSWIVILFIVMYHMNNLFFHSYNVPLCDLFSVYSHTVSLKFIILHQLINFLLG